MFKKILVPLDGSVVENEVLEYASGVARNSNAELVLMRPLNVRTRNPIFAPPWASAGSEQEMEALRVVFRTALEKTAKRLRACDLRVTTQVYAGDPANAIVECAEAVKADAIIMSAHGVKCDQAWLDREVTTQVLKGARMPVFLVGGDRRTPGDLDQPDYPAPLA